MKINEIPAVLFLEFSKLGNTDSRWIEKDGNSGQEFLVKPLNISQRFPGAIGLGGRGDYGDDVLLENKLNKFILWDRVPEGKRDVLEPQPILTLVVGRYDNCHWCHGSGHGRFHRTRDDLHIRFDEQGLSIFNPVAGLIGQIIKRAQELAVECEEFWEDDPRVQK